MPIDCEDPTKPLSLEEVNKLLRITLHGSLPSTLCFRMLTTLGHWIRILDVAERWSKLDVEHSAIIRGLIRDAERKQWPIQSEGRQSAAHVLLELLNAVESHFDLQQKMKEREPR